MTGISRELLGFLDELVVFLAGQVQGFGLGKIAQGLGKTFHPAVQVVLQAILLDEDLFLEQGIKHHGPGPGVLDALEGIQILGKGAGGRDQRVFQFQSHVSRAEVDHLSSLNFGNLPWRLLTPGPTRTPLEF